jgi:hypothetical protein
MKLCPGLKPLKGIRIKRGFTLRVKHRTLHVLSLTFLQQNQKCGYLSEY